MKYIKYSYIVKAIKKVVQSTAVLSKKVTKQKTNKKKTKTTTSSNTVDVTFAGTTQGTGSTVVSITEPEIKEYSASELKNKPHGHFEGVYWVWPNGQRTHVRFIDQAIRQMKPLPFGFYIEAEKEKYLTNMKNMLRKAKQLKLPDSVDIRNEE